MKDPRGNFSLSISKEELSALPPAHFEGEIVVVDDLSQLEEAIEELRKAPIIGFDTETKPTFQKGQLNFVALIQLSTENKSFLFRVCEIGIPESLKKILEDEAVCKVGLSIKDDFHSLAKISKINPAGFIDIQNYVKEFNIADCSLTKIHAILFGQRISKSQQLTNWEAPVLTRKQQEYASLDALACINIYKFLQSGKFKPTQSTYCKFESNHDDNQS